MKNLIISTLILFFTTLVVAAVPTDAEAKIYDDTLRLHILANSDSEDDQALKLEIRNRLLEKYGKMFEENITIDETIEMATALIPDMERNSEEWMKELGYGYSAKITVGKEWYDTREYENFTLPSGIYTSLKIVIGSGEGKNWWCVMYPPMCLELACESAPRDDGVINYTAEEIKLINGGKYNVKFKVLEFLSDAFAKNG